MGTNPDVVVLREGTEGLSMESYAEALRERRSDHEVAHARTPAAERELVPQARVVTGITLAEPLLERTDRLELFACTFAGTDHMPTDALAARGGVVDTDALVAALQSNGIRGAALDVTDPEPLPPDHPLWDLENCLITPHTSGHTPKHWDRLADIVAGNVAALEDGGELENAVSRPGPN